MTLIQRLREATMSALRRVSSEGLRPHAAYLIVRIPGLCQTTVTIFEVII